MTALILHLPDGLHEEIQLLVKSEGISIDQFVTLAAAEKVSALRTVEHLRAEGQEGSRSDFDAFLAAVPDVESAADDSLE